MNSPLPLRHFFLALAVVAVWGTNFVVIKLALGQLPPLLFGALRFAFALLPAVFFLRRPAVPWANLAGYGLLIGAGQFGLLYLAMNRPSALMPSTADCGSLGHGYVSTTTPVSDFMARS